MSRTILTNARIILDEQVIDGTVVVEGDRIRAIDTGRSTARDAVDLGGDYLAPGLIEMHTDNAEKHFEPRPGAIWPDGLAAMLAHDAQMTASGVTTVYDSVCAGYAAGKRREIFARIMEGIEQAIAHNAFRIEHKAHIRCELSGDDLIEQVEPYARREIVQLISLMDHTPGQRQWRDLEAMRRYHVGTGLFTEEAHERDMNERLAQGPLNKQANLPAILDMFAGRGLVIATHDDTTEADIGEAVAVGAVISEFPTTLEAAVAARKHGLVTIAGAPNVVRGGSNSGGVSVALLHAEGQLDGLSSDYVPSSLLQAVLILADHDEAKLPATMALVTRNVADAVRLSDRGRLQPGLRADLVRFRLAGRTPVVTGVWCRGRLVG
jgi:alpha-D-ribose 1-methylphosphonate 5-triphosphate diphosphatase